MNITISKVQALLFDGGTPYTKECDIYISGDKIVSVDNVPEGFTAEKVIDGKNRLAIPGLINAHTHAYMSIFRNIADDLEFNDWLFGRILPLEDKLTPEDMYWGTLLGNLEMIATGTTSYVDMAINMEGSVKAALDSGMRAWVSRGLVGEGADEGGRVRLEENLNACAMANEKVSVILGPHAPYSCDTKYLKIVTAAAKKHNLPMTIHLSESIKEVEDIKKAHGVSPIELMEKIGLFEVPVIAAHCVQLSDNDIEILARNNVTVATNPISNLKLANGFAPLVKLKNAGVNIAIGTDSAASNNTLNMFSDINFASLIHKGLLHDPLAVSASDAIRYATVGCATALGEKIGRIEEGFKADIALLDTDLPQFCPRNNFISALCYSANGSEVQTVIINGEIVMENKEFKTLDKEKIYYECQKRIERIR